MHIDKNSYGTIALVYLFAAAVLAPLYAFHCHPVVKLVVTVFMLALCTWQTLFFRVPDRDKAGSSKLVSAVADGKIVILEKAFEGEFLKRDCMQVSVYMDFWDVHANFWPIEGEVTYYQYHPGKHFLAFLPKASEDNEHTCIGMRNAEGAELLFKQLAGTFARRIVCYAEPGLETAAGEQCGIIKFGSRIDYFLPLDAKINVKIGQQVRACETIIAEI